MFQDCHELIAANAENRAVLEHLADDAGSAANQLVSRLMPIGVVHFLQKIGIKDNDTVLQGMVLRGNHSLLLKFFHSFYVGGSIAKPCQLVPIDMDLQLRHHLPDAPDQCAKFVPGFTGQLHVQVPCRNLSRRFGNDHHGPDALPRQPDAEKGHHNDDEQHHHDEMDQHGVAVRINIMGKGRNPQPHPRTEIGLRLIEAVLVGQGLAVCLRGIEDSPVLVQQADNPVLIDRHSLDLVDDVVEINIDADDPHKLPILLHGDDIGNHGAPRCRVPIGHAQFCQVLLLWIVVAVLMDALILPLEIRQFLAPLLRRPAAEEPRVPHPLRKLHVEPDAARRIFCDGRKGVLHPRKVRLPVPCILLQPPITLQLIDSQLVHAVHCHDGIIEGMGKPLTIDHAHLFHVIFHMLVNGLAQSNKTDTSQHGCRNEYDGKIHHHEVCHDGMAVPHQHENEGSHGQVHGRKDFPIEPQPGVHLVQIIKDARNIQHKKQQEEKTVKGYERQPVCLMLPLGCRPPIHRRGHVKGYRLATRRKNMGMPKNKATSKSFRKRIPAYSRGAST